MLVAVFSTVSGPTRSYIARNRNILFGMKLCDGLARRGKEHMLSELAMHNRNALDLLMAQIFHPVMSHYGHVTGSFA